MEGFFFPPNIYFINIIKRNSASLKLIKKYWPYKNKFGYKIPCFYDQDLKADLSTFFGHLVILIKYKTSFKWTLKIQKLMLNHQIRFKYVYFTKMRNRNTLNNKSKLLMHKYSSNNNVKRKMLFSQAFITEQNEENKTKYNIHYS